MATMDRTPRRSYESRATPGVRSLAACLGCGARLDGRADCPGCERSYPDRSGILEAIGPLEGRNRVAAAFYDGPGWLRFRRWERRFLQAQGGETRARRQVLRHLDAPPFARVLEVGIGDGANLDRLPADWTAYGVDIARTRLEACQGLRPQTRGRLAWAEAEALPFADGTFDACWTLGGFNYFRDRGLALSEMRRVTRAGGTLIVADERPTLHRLGIGHLTGLRGLDRAWMGWLGLDPEFIAMVFEGAFDVDAEVLGAWPGATRHPIWGGLGYCYVDSTTRADEPDDPLAPLRRLPSP